jgi:hypothetical protein
MNDTQLLERLSSAYATLEAPAPSAALAEILESGAVGADTDDERRDAVVIPLVRPQTRLRARHLVAAMVATFVLFSGLAVAGALPDPVQRQVSSVVSHLGIDLPSPDSGPAHDTTDSPRQTDRQGPTATSEPSAGAATTTTVAGGGTGLPAGGGRTSTPGSPSTTTPGGLPLGDVGDLGGVTGGGSVTTLPPSGGDPLLPPVTLPPISLPPLTIPPISLPPLTIPPISLPPLTIPQLPLPLPLDLPLL